MNLRYFKNIIPAAAIILASAGMTSCVGDLDVTPIDPSTNMTVDEPGLFTKCYANMALAGQTGPDGDCDIDGLDGGTTGFVRQLFNTQELPTDEAICAWGDPGIPEYNYATWDSSHPMIRGLYYRLYAGINYCNHYLDVCAGVDEKREAEVRFLRALYYYYLLDAFGNVPFALKLSAESPEQIKRADLYAWIETEVKEIYNSLAAPAARNSSQEGYGRADQDAANMLLARLYLNAEVYTGTAHWAEAKEYAEKVINGPHKLFTDQSAGYDPSCGYTPYQMLFMGDNGETGAATESILSVIQDGVTSAAYGCTLFIMASTWKNDMNEDGDYGSSEFWAGNRSRSQLVKKFFPSSDPTPDNCKNTAIQASDDRALFCGKGTLVEKKDDGTDKVTVTERDLVVKKPGEFTSGYSVGKFRNTYSKGTPHHAKFCDTDFFLMRAGEAYLIAAEADARLNGGTTTSTGAGYINALRSRAHATTQSQYNLKQILDERARELYFEGFRRTDLIRYGLFHSNEYLWDWKGGSEHGVGFSKDRCLYPLPADDVNANPNLKGHQNPGYGN